MKAVPNLGLEKAKKERLILKHLIFPCPLTNFTQLVEKKNKDILNFSD